MLLVDRRKLRCGGPCRGSPFVYKVKHSIVGQVDQVCCMISLDAGLVSMCR